jgi:hypothetical protein
MYFVNQIPMTKSRKSINLSAWITQLTEQRYVTVDKGHKTFKWKENTIENSKVIRFNKIVHLYKLLSMTNNKVALKSEKSKIYIFHLFPIKAEVIWTMKIIVKEDYFRCLVEVIIENKTLLFLSYLQLNNLFLKQHVENETIGYLRVFVKYC